MPATTTLRRLGVVAALLMAASSCVAAPGWTRHDLGAFWLEAPPGWSQAADRAVDSSAGHLTAEGLRLDYDFGLYADPLPVPDGATDVRERAVVVDGLPARQVRYRLRDGSARPMYYLGIHVPDIRSTRMGPLKLTVLAASADKKQIRRAEAAMATIRFKPAATP